MKSTEQQIATFLAPFSTEIQNLTQQLREYLKTETKPSMELMGDSTISVNIGYGFTEKAWDCYCAIIVYSKHINFSFPSGAMLVDPESLLKGKGKRIRHIRINNLTQAMSPSIKKLLIQARNNALLLVDQEFDTDHEITSIIKPISGVKKRPQ